MKLRITLLLLPALLLVPTSGAATFVVPSDAQMVEMADAIVAGRVTGSRSVGRANTIETDSTMVVTRSFKGPFGPGEQITVIEPGGVLESVALVIPGVPEFRPGEEVILFLEQKPSGDWSTLFLTLGKFKANNGIMVRGSGDIHGWDEEGRPHLERPRDRKRFVQFIEDVLRGQEPETDYFMSAAPLTTEASEDVVFSLEATAYPPSAYLTTVVSSHVQRRKLLRDHLCGCRDPGRPEWLARPDRRPVRSASRSRARPHSRLQTL